MSRTQHNTSSDLSLNIINYIILCFPCLSFLIYKMEIVIPVLHFHTRILRIKNDTTSREETLTLSKLSTLLLFDPAVSTLKFILQIFLYSYKMLNVKVCSRQHCL